jgi:two-component system, LytTR family, response regulator
MVSVITYLIADDDPLYLAVTKSQLELIPNLICSATCHNAIEASAYLQNQLPDLLILDIEMPGLTGIQLAKSLTKLPFIIFISSHPHYAVDAFEVDAVDYLVKPISKERMIRAVEKVRILSEMKRTVSLQDGFKPAENNSFFIKDKNVFTRINNSQVLYIESLGDFINIFLDNGQKKIALVSLKNIEQQLPSKDFIRISRTHIVNKEKITALESTAISLNNIKLNVGKTYTETVLQAVMGNNAIKRFI